MRPKTDLRVSNKTKMVILFFLIIIIFSILLRKIGKKTNEKFVGDGQRLCNFIKNTSKALNGYNDEHLKSVTRNDCKKACCKRDWCKSFDYYNKTNECDLSKAVASEVGGLYNSKGIYDHYSLPKQTYTHTMWGVYQN